MEEEERRNRREEWKGRTECEGRREEKMGEEIDWERKGRRGREEEGRKGEENRSEEEKSII